MNTVKGYRVYINQDNELLPSNTFFDVRFLSDAKSPIKTMIKIIAARPIVTISFVLLPLKKSS